jgi:hypothetical protein
MKFLAILVSVFTITTSLNVSAAVPTEEGLLKNLNNAGIPGNLITIKAMVQGSSPGNVAEADASKSDYYKFVLSIENPNVISLFQVAYSNGQMQNTQIKDVKYIPDLVAAIKRDKSPDRALFYAALVTLSTNKPNGMEAFLEKSGVQIVKNKNLLNEDKMKLLRAYRTYLANNKGKGEANSPLNPPDPQNKAKVVELFRANTFERSKNIELAKVDNEFMWKVDWKSTQAYFSNEERRLRRLEFTNGEFSTKLEANEYVMFNGTNELPKFISLKDSKGQTGKMQILGLDTKTNREKKLSERYEEAKKAAPSSASENYSFLY